MVEVAVIGAGAAGIITARQLIKLGIRPHIFERLTTIGGAWQCPNNNNNGNSIYDNTASSIPVVSTRISSSIPHSTASSPTMMPTSYPQMWDTLTPNLSKYTCCFSDMPWSSDTPMFPSLQQMNQYLNDYCTTYNILSNNNNDNNNDDNHNNHCTIHYGCTVTRVSRYPANTATDTVSKSSSTQQQHSHRYEVQWNIIEDVMDHVVGSTDIENHKNVDTDPSTLMSGIQQQQQQSQIFDGVVIATGYFSQPVWPIPDLTLLQTPPPRTEDVNDPTHNHHHETTLSLLPPTFIHSSHYQSSMANTYRNLTVAIIGNSFSAHEIASEISFSQMRSDDTSHQNHHQTGKVIHIIGDPNKVPYVVPRNLVLQQQEKHETTNWSSSTQSLQDQPTMVVPIDSVFYRRQSDRNVSSTVQSFETVIMDTDSCYKKHTTLQQYVGRRKIQQASEKGYNMIPTDPSIPPHLSISDQYIDLVIDDKINIVPGRVINVTRRINTDNHTKYDIQLNDGTTTTTTTTVVSDIDAIICCTGYQCALHDFIDSDILQVFQYDPNDTFAPMISVYDTFHPTLPNFGMVGMYKGPYFGIMELQAKLYTAILMQNHRHEDNDRPYPPTTISSTIPRTVIDEALVASKTRRSHQPRSQFPHFDYIGMMDHMTQLLNDIEKTNTTNNTATVFPQYKKGMMVSPLFYHDSKPPHVLEQALQEYNEQLHIHSDQHMAKSVLSALIGTWTFDRVITDTYTQTTQIVTGTIRYTLRPDGSVRYREDGIITLPNGKTLDVFREYDYIADEDDGCLEIKFVENGVQTYRFLSLKFRNAVSSSMSKDMNSKNDWLAATSDHLCVKDMYTGTFQIQLDGCSANAVRITYNVQGPKKDYVSVTNLQPTL